MPQERLDLALRHLRQAGNQVVGGHEAAPFTGVAHALEERGFRECTCGFRTVPGDQQETLDDWSWHRRVAVLAGAEILTPSGERL